MKSRKDKDYNKDFDEMYEKYIKEVEKWSGGLVKTDKAEFVKMYAFYITTVNPSIEEYFHKLHKYMAK